MPCTWVRTECFRCCRAGGQQEASGKERPPLPALRLPGPPPEHLILHQRVCCPTGTSLLLLWVHVRQVQLVKVWLAALGQAQLVKVWLAALGQAQLVKL